VTFFTYWQRITVSNPALAKGDTKVTFTVAEFERQLRKAYDQGWTDKREAMEKAAPAAKDPFRDLFRGL
jgi:hypothetical protein